MIGLNSYKRFLILFFRIAQQAKNKIKIFITLLVVFLVTVQVSAIDIYSDTFKLKNGDTYLGVFDTSALDAAEKSFLSAYLSSDKCLITYHPNAVNGSGNGIYYLIYYVDAVSSTVSISENGLSELHFNGSAGSVVAKGTCWSAESDGTLKYLYDSSFSPNSWLSDTVIIGGTAATSINFPSPVSSYAADYVGTLYLEDNSGLMSEVAPDPDDSGGILGFLSSFWDKLKDFFVSLFVPSSGYITDWYKSISSAFNAKFSNLTALYTGLTGFFSGLHDESSDLSFSVAADSLYDGNDAFSFNISDYFSDMFGFVKGVLTGLVVLCTIIVCYRRIISMFSE